MNLYDDQFSERHDFPIVEKPEKIVIIASTGRCGSHMLGHALYETGSFGFPLEYANPTNLNAWKSRFDIDDFSEVLTAVQRCRTSPNGVFGIKIHYGHIKQFGGFPKLAQCLPNAYYVLLSRADVVKQAVSLSLAFQTGVWIAGQKPTNDNPRYSYFMINSCLRQILLDNASWRYTLAANGCNYMEMNFDYVRNHLAESIQAIANFAEVDVDPQRIPEQQVTKVQSGDINRQWEQQFRADFDGTDELLTSATT